MGLPLRQYSQGTVCIEHFLVQTPLLTICELYRQHSEEEHPPFPTYYQEDEQEEKLPENLFAKELHSFDDPSLLFEETEEEKKAALAALKMSKKAKIAKIR